MRRSTGWSVATAPRPALQRVIGAQNSFDGPLPDAENLTSHAGGSVAQRQRVFCRGIIPSSHQRELRAVNSWPSGAVCGAAKKCLATAALRQQRSSAAALGRADQMVKADRRHSGGGSLRRVDHSGGGSHAESGQTEYIMLLVICLDFLHFHFF